jgi:formylmethanofuran dehydrogenase subunit E
MASRCLAEEARPRLPQPQYDRQPTDPPWLAEIVQIHGHLGPAVVAGARMGMAGLRAVDAKGYFDVEVTCEGPLAMPPRACFLDGVQLGTGATLGKRNLSWVQGESVVLRVKNTQTGKTAELCPAPALVSLLAWNTPDIKNAPKNSPEAVSHLEDVARKIASMSEREILTVTAVGDAPPK